MEDVTVFTIGHSNHALNEFTQLLQKHAIEILIDVRSKPQSRWVPHFNRNNLETAIPAIGIEYQWMGDHLGGLPNDPALHKPNPQRKKKTDSATIVNYRKVARQGWFRDGISKLIEIASQKRTAIMCSEENPENCHRSLLVGQALMQKGITVLHIRKNGELEPQPTP